MRAVVNGTVEVIGAGLESNPEMSKFEEKEHADESHDTGREKKS